MQPRIFIIALGMGLCLTGCEKQNAPQPPEATAPRTSEASPSPDAKAPADATVADAQAAAEEIRPLLLAHHQDDLPSRTTLDAHPGAPEGLRWLANNDGTMIVKVRALLLLQLYPDESSEQVVLALASDPAQHRKLRAAAVTALSGWDLSERQDLREVALAAVQSTDVSVAVAGAQALTDVTPARVALQAQLDGGELHPTVAKAVRKSLGTTEVK
ncbi:MAG: hypothetical protein AAF799_20575 [Myxococcota bacterium]